MAKNKKSTQSSKRIIYILSAVIAILVASLIFSLTNQDNTNRTDTSNETNAINVELGSYQYDFQGTKAVKLSDENVTSLDEFLTTAAKKDISSNCEKSYYWVMAFSDDRKQVLLNYGCENPGSRMFAVQESGKWKFISPTNQFDMLGVPLCSHVNENDITKSIAPVCYNETNDTEHSLKYQVR